MADLSIRKKEPPRRTTWRTNDLLRAAVLFAAVYVAAQLLWFTSNILLVAFLGILFGVALSAGVDRLKKHGVPRVAGTAAIVLTLVGLLVLAGTLMAPTVGEQTRELRSQFPQALDRLENWVDERDGLFRVILPPDGAADDPAATEAADEPTDEPAEPGADTAGTPAGDPEADAAVTSPDTVNLSAVHPTEDSAAQPAEDSAAPPAQESAPPGQRAREPVAEQDAGPPASVTLRQQLAQQLGDLGAHLFAFLTSTVTVLASLLLILFIAIYIAVEPETYRRGILLLIPPRGRDRAEEVLGESSYILRRWLLTQLVTMIVIGTVTTIGLMILDVRAALALGILAGLLEFIPIFGPIIAAIPAIAMGFLESPTTALYVLMFYVVIQQLESQILIPILMKEGVDVPPIITVLAQALMALLFGFLGLLVAVPLVAVAIVFVKMLYVQEVVGEDVILPREALE